MDEKNINKYGVTSFTSSPSTSYRYNIELKDNQMTIWMEDCATKKQWCKNDMLIYKYLTSSNTIPNAGPADYVKCFYDCLGCDLNGSCPVQRTLSELNGGMVRLELTLTIPFFRSSWVAKYNFDLEPVSLSQVDVLKSTIRDQNDELKRLRNELSAFEGIPFIELEAGTTSAKARLQWNEVDCAAFVVEDDDGVIEARIEGVYSIRGVINCVPSVSNQCVTILKNDVCIQRYYCAFTGKGVGVWVSTPLDFVAFIKEGDMLTITCTCRVTTSYLSIVGMSSIKGKADS